MSAIDLRMATTQDDVRWRYRCARVLVRSCARMLLLHHASCQNGFQQRKGDNVLRSMHWVRLVRVTLMKVAQTYKKVGNVPRMCWDQFEWPLTTPRR
jgi:hypothetical protein